ncbi:hypothetical protein [Mycoplasma phocoenae]|uniref:Uncharacterized protein n=1 Tax=Mycoplasma phocoenae TaxID=754517 RepID=A0A858U7L7_9MOLU|nr:hypothetical protein [Mycoplasma phocoenae]QJG67213.1 hypothetical protein HGG69_02775 [Mycoplasma phocoenae]
MIKENNITQNWDNVYIDPVNNFYQKTVPKIDEKIIEFIKERIQQINPEAETQVEISLRKMLAIKDEVVKRKKMLNINLRKFFNGIIKILFFFIIGLLFLGIYKKNNKVINEYKNFCNEKEQEYQKLFNKKKNILHSIYSCFTMNDIKNEVLKKMGLNNVEVNNFNDVLVNINSDEKSTIFFTNIEKYDVRNSYFYDIAYLKMFYAPITYYGSKTFSYRGNDDKWHTKVVHANYDHMTPFLKEYQKYLYPTNYLPRLVFRSIAPVSEKELKEQIKHNTLPLENKEFFEKYNFMYNDNVSFVNFFQLITQEKFIDWHKFSSSINKFNGTFEKLPYGFIVHKNKKDSSIDNPMIDWILLDYINKNELINFKDVNKKIKESINDHMEHLLGALTLTFCNKYLASEVYSELGSQFKFEYKDDQIYQNIPADTEHGLFILTKLYKYNYLNLYKNRASKKTVFSIENSIKIANKKTKVFNVKATSFYTVKKIKYISVYDFNVGRVSVPVEYDDYIPFTETKQVIFSPTFKLQNGQLLNSNVKKQDSEFSKPVNEDDNLQMLINANRIFFNYLIKDKNQNLDSTVDYVKDFNDRFKKYKNYYSVEIDKYGTYVFIDHADKIPNEIKKQMAIYLK